MTTLMIAFVVTVCVVFFDVYSHTGRASSERLPRLKPRQVWTLWRQYRLAKQARDLLMRASLFRPHEREIQVARVESEVLLAMCRALWKRDARLMIAATEELERSQRVVSEMKAARAMSVSHRRRVGSAQWN
jgi:hypothetical protein